MRVVCKRGNCFFDRFPKRKTKSFAGRGKMADSGGLSVQSPDYLIPVRGGKTSNTPKRRPAKRGQQTGRGNTTKRTRKQAGAGKVKQTGAGKKKQTGAGKRKHTRKQTGAGTKKQTKNLTGKGKRGRKTKSSSCKSKKARKTKSNK